MKVSLAHAGVLFGVFAIVMVAFSFPSVVGGRGGAGLTAAGQAAVAKEQAFCEANVSGVDCGCFAQKSGQIQAFDQQRARGYQYALQEDLARGQATRTC